MGVVAATWPSANVQADTINAYATFLSDVDYQDAFAAVGKLAATSKFLPSVAEIRETAAEIRLELPSAFVAWEQFTARSEMHPLVRRVAKAMGGWWSYNTSDNPSIFRAQFLKLYAEARSEAVTGEATGQPMLLPPPERKAISERALDSAPMTEEQKREFIANVNKMFGR